MPGFCCLNLYKSSRPWKGGEEGGEEEEGGGREGKGRKKRERQGRGTKWRKK